MIKIFLLRFSTRVKKDMLDSIYLKLGIEGDEIKCEKAKSLLNNFGVDFSPVYSVMGSVISQEVVGFYERVKIPALNWLVYDMEEGGCECIQ